MMTGVLVPASLLPFGITVPRLASPLTRTTRSPTCLVTTPVYHSTNLIMAVHHNMIYRILRGVPHRVTFPTFLLYISASSAIKYTYLGL